METLSMHTIRQNWNKLSLIDFKDGLKEKAEWQKQREMSSGNYNFDGSST